MASHVHLHTMTLKSLLTLSTEWRETSISIYFTSKQYGAHTLKEITKERSVSLATIGKTSEEDLTSSNTSLSSASHGTPKLLCRRMQMDASTNTDAISLMVGRNKSTTHQSTRYFLAETWVLVRRYTVHTSTLTSTKDLS